MNNKLKNILLASIPFILLITAWFLGYSFKIFPDWMLPSPIQTFSSFLELSGDGTILKLVLISMTNALPAFVLAFITAIILGVLIGINKTIGKILTPFLASIYIIPSLAWLPFIILFSGFSRQTIWSVIFISSFMKMIYNVIGGVQNVNSSWILAAKNLGLNKLQIVLKVIIPSALPQIMTGIRLGFGSAWRSLVGVEMLVVTFGGLGKFIWMAQWYFNFDRVFIGIFIISFVGLIFEQFVFKNIEKITLVRWGNLNH
jgi:sulfonate transport system permease protein